MRFVSCLREATLVGELLRLATLVFENAGIQQSPREGGRRWDERVMAPRKLGEDISTVTSLGLPLINCPLREPASLWETGNRERVA